MGMLFNLQGLQKMFSFTEKVFSESYSHFPILAIFGEFGVIFLRHLEEKSVGMLFRLRGLQVMFLLWQIVFKNL